MITLEDLKRIWRIARTYRSTRLELLCIEVIDTCSATGAKIDEIIAWARKLARRRQGLS